MKPVKQLAIGIAVALVVGTTFVYSGLMPPGADEPHSALVYKLLETTRERGIAVRADDIMVPPLDDPALIRSGAGNYNSMCSGCHLMPGVKESELSKGLYPVPPALAEVDDLEPAEAFWVIKHGIKASGMPAWGKSMEDRYIWGMVAFLMKLPTLSEEQYKKEVACSGGHSHGGSVTVEHAHEEPAVDCGDDGDDGLSDEPMEHDHGAAHDHSAMSESAPDDAGGHEHATGAEHAHGEASAPEMDHSKMQGMDHSNMQGMDHSKMQGMDHSKMQGMDHSKGHGADHSAMPGTSHGAAAVPKSLPVRNAAESAVQAFQDALQVGNRNLVLQWLDPAVRIEEGGHTENSRAEYASGHLQSDIDFLKTARVYPQSRSSRLAGDTATVSTQTRIVAQPDGKPIEILSNEAASLKMTSEGWRIVHIQWSATPVDKSVSAPRAKAAPQAADKPKQADDGHNHEH